MRKMYVICRNHMDLTWRRCFQRSYSSAGYLIRPYMELEQLQLDWWLDAIERDGVCYDVEQTITIREYLKRNPDSLPRLQRLISEGKLRVLGGGESVIDYNMVDGECVIRNHFYSRRYLEDTFHFAPKFAACPDTFGLSAQLPQLFRMLGYPAISVYSRVFPDAKPVWQGLSGHRIAIETAKFTDVDDSDFVTYASCSNCHGEGCAVCRHTGMDVYYRQFSRPKEVASLRERIRKASEEKTDIVFSVSTEEALEPDHFKEFVEGLARDFGLEPVFIGLEDYIAEKNARLLTSVEAGQVPPEQIDSRREGNPVASGCYVSRIRIKQENRRMEVAIAAAERFSVLAGRFGFEYPAQAIRDIWLKILFYQFHDGVPSSHSDEAYHELMDAARDVRTASMRIVHRALDRICQEIPAKDNSFAVFNPLGWDVRNKELEAVIRLKSNSHPPKGCLRSADGTSIPFICVGKSVNYSDDAWTIRFSADLPAFGYRVFRYEPGEELPETEAVPVRDSGAIENECYRVSLSEFGIEEIYDKRLGKVIACDGVCSPYVSEDIGHLWGRWSARWYAERADKPFCVDTMTPSASYHTQVETKSFADRQTAVVRVTFDRWEEHLDRLQWCMTVTLRSGSDKVEFHIDTEWEARDLRLSARFPLSFVTEDDKAFYEIPLGQLERPYVETYDGQLGYSDDQAALQYLSVYNEKEDWSIGLYNTGTPAHMLQNGTLYVGLMRTPTRMANGYGTQNARETGPCSFDFAISSWKGAPAQGNPVRTGWEYNACYPFKELSEKAGSLPEAGSLIVPPCRRATISGMKQSEDGQAVILHCYEPYGWETVEILPQGAAECGLLTEEAIHVPADGRFSFAPWEIKAIRVEMN